MPNLDVNYHPVVRALRMGELTPLLGAGANLTGRPADQKFEKGVWAPSGTELAEHLAKQFGYPDGTAADLEGVPPDAAEMARKLAQEFGYPPRTAPDLARVSQYAVLTSGPAPFYKELHSLFELDYPPTILHELWGRVCAAIRAGTLPAQRYPLLITTNYDSALEQALERVDEPFDLVFYYAGRKDGEIGRFFHVPPRGAPRPIEVPNEYLELDCEERAVILKIHGAVDPQDPERDSYVITEDHYIQYLAQSDVQNFFPLKIHERLTASSFLFLGYSLRDWNLRVLLHQIRAQQSLSYKSWAVLLEPEEVYREYWLERGVKIIEADLAEYALGLNDALELGAPADPSGGDE